MRGPLPAGMTMEDLQEGDISTGPHERRTWAYLGEDDSLRARPSTSRTSPSFTHPAARPSPPQRRAPALRMRVSWGGVGCSSAPGAEEEEDQKSGGTATSVKCPMEGARALTRRG